MEGKKSVIIYVDWGYTFDALGNEEAGKLIKHFFNYVRDLNPEPPDKLTQIAFEPVKQTLKRDLLKWRQIINKRAESGKLGGIKSGESRRWKQKEANEASDSKTKQNEANEASDSKTKQNEANEAVSDTVSVSETIKEKVITPELKSSAAKYDSFISFFNKKLNKWYRGDSKSKRQFMARLKEGYTGDDFALAIKNLLKDAHHIDSEFQWATPELITRVDKLQYFINIPTE